MNSLLTQSLTSSLRSWPSAASPSDWMVFFQIDIRADHWPYCRQGRRCQERRGLPGANVTVKGTYYGGTTDIDGNVRIEKVNPGAYTIEVSLLGFKLVRFTDVKVEPGQTATIRAKLEETVLAIGQDVVVVGEKPLFDIRGDGEQEEYTARPIFRLCGAERPVGGRDAAGRCAGRQRNPHPRRTDARKRAYLLDGISVQDPMAGTGFGLQLSRRQSRRSRSSPGGYNAEYGQATSGS